MRRISGTLMAGAKPGGSSGPVIVPVKRHGTIALRRSNAAYAGSVWAKRKSGQARWSCWTTWATAS